MRFFFLLSAPSGAPENAHAVTNSSTSIILHWTPPKTAEQNGEIISYTIYANSSDRSFVKFLNVTGNTTALAASGLQPYTDYLFMIQAVTVGGSGPYSHPVTNKTFEAGKVFNKDNGTLHSLQCLNLFLEPRGDLLLGVVIFFFFLMKAVLVFASDCICVDAVNIHTFFLCLSVFGLTCSTRVFAYSCVRVNGVYTCLLGLSEFKLTWFTGTCFCSVCVWYEVVDTCFYLT